MFLFSYQSKHCPCHLSITSSALVLLHPEASPAGLNTHLLQVRIYYRYKSCKIQTIYFCLSVTFGQSSHIIIFTNMGQGGGNALYFVAIVILPFRLKISKSQ